MVLISGLPSVSLRSFGLFYLMSVLRSHYVADQWSVLSFHIVNFTVCVIFTPLMINSKNSSQ